MRELEYPFDSSFILKKKKSLRRRLFSDGTSRIKKRIAILGGSTTHDIKDVLELFLLNYGIEGEFYESEYAQYFSDVMFDNPELSAFKPDVIFIHTTARNIREFPRLGDSAESVSSLVEDTFAHFEALWRKIAQVYRCPVIQNNFEPPFFRLLGNKDFSDIHGRVNFIMRLNMKFSQYAESHDSFFINDINYLASCFGVQKWADSFYWHMYKYALSFEAIPEFAFNVANIVKSLFGKNKKALVLDLDNTLWGGVVGDDGADNIEIGQETPVAQLYSEFQGYVKAHKDMGVLLAVDSKNEEENARAGLSRPDSVLSFEDFVSFKANWKPKSENMAEIARELNLGADSFVFVDDNPAEREIVRTQVGGCAVPEVTGKGEGDISSFIPILDRSGFFEVTVVSADDLKRTEMYRANVARAQLEASFSSYEDYLRSLEMKAEIGPFCPLYMARIAQLTNKSNQFNLTTKRCTQADIESLAADADCITLYGKLSDKFGDNGVVSVVAGRVAGKEFHIDLWLMSCRVLKRDMEYAMMDALMEKCAERNIEKVVGYYFPTAKNKMVRDFYALHGFSKAGEDENGNTTWVGSVAEYKKRNTVISVVGAHTLEEKNDTKRDF